MSNKPVVVSITGKKCEIVAEDLSAPTKRFILGIGKQRIAFDFTTKVTELAPGTGDKPATVQPLKQKRQKPSA